MGSPLDLLTYAEALHAFLRQEAVVRGILDGEITCIDDLSPSRRARMGNDAASTSQ